MDSLGRMTCSLAGVREPENTLLSLFRGSPHTDAPLPSLGSANDASVPLGLPTAAKRSGKRRGEAGGEGKWSVTPNVT